MRKVLLWVGAIGVGCPLPWLLVFALWLDTMLNTRPVFAMSLMLMYVVGWVCVFWGSCLWVRGKHRHWIFILWALLAPIGYLGMALLKDKTK